MYLTVEETKTVTLLKLNKHVFLEEIPKKVYEKVKNQIGVDKVCFYYQLANIFHLPNIMKIALNYIERCFSIISETRSFLDLDYAFVKNIISSSDLNIDSEREVLCAVNNWVDYNVAQRQQYAKRLLLEVRLPLLSDSTLKTILNEFSCFKNNNDCLMTIRKYLQNDKWLYPFNVERMFTARKCSQNAFRVLLCGGFKSTCFGVTDVHELDMRDLTSVRSLSGMLERQFHSKAVCVRGNVFVLGGMNCRVENVTYMGKYSPSENTWTKETSMHDDRTMFCVCSFLCDIYVIGGETKDVPVKSCAAYDTKLRAWSDIAGMNEERTCADCTTFEGRVVVTGGVNARRDPLNSVAAFECGSWSYDMPSMIKSRYDHSCVAVRNKLFVIEFGVDSECEVFDSFCKRFVALQTPRNLEPIEMSRYNQVVSVGGKVVVFANLTPLVAFYDVDTDEWSEEHLELTGDIESYSCVALPWF